MFLPSRPFLSAPVCGLVDSTGLWTSGRQDSNQRSLGWDASHYTAYIDAPPWVLFRLFFLFRQLFIGRRCTWCGAHHVLLTSSRCHSPMTFKALQFASGRERMQRASCEVVLRSHEKVSSARTKLPAALLKRHRRLEVCATSAQSGINCGRGKKECCLALEQQELHVWDNDNCRHLWSFYFHLRTAVVRNIGHSSAKL
jgi:hypothetical protein